MRHGLPFTSLPSAVIRRRTGRAEANRVASFTYRRQLTIEWGQCDPAGIVFNSRFFEMFDASTWQMFQAALGVKPHELSGAFGIMGIPLVDVRANFLKPIKFGDVVDLTSRISEFRRSSFDVEHRLSVDGELAVEGGETRVWASRRKDDPEKISGTSIPADVIAKFGPA
jgi:4-hydroxybenzoyl-CoA thioesterase